MSTVHCPVQVPAYLPGTSSSRPGIELCLPGTSSSRPGIELCLPGTSSSRPGIERVLADHRQDEARL